MDNNVTTLPPADKWFPYTETEYNELKSIAATITTHIPNDKVDWVWSNHNRINGNNETRPCTCGSAAGHWARAMETIRSFIKRIEG